MNEIASDDRRTWFFALPLRDGAALLRRLTPPLSGVHLLHELDLHLTLAFLGRRSRTEAELAWSRVHSLLQQLADESPQLTAAGIVPMGPVTRFSALATEPEGDDACQRLSAVMRRCTRRLRDFGVSLHADGARPHVTVARLRRNASMPMRHDALRWAGQQDVVGLPLHFLAPALFCRDPDPDAGTVYRVVLRCSAD